MCVDMRTHHQNRDPTVVAECQWCTVYNVSGVVVASGVANVVIVETVLKQCNLNSFVHPVDKSNDLHTKILLTSGKECVDFWAFSPDGQSKYPNWASCFEVRSALQRAERGASNSERCSRTFPCRRPATDSNQDT